MTKITESQRVEKLNNLSPALTVVVKSVIDQYCSTNILILREKI